MLDEIIVFAFLVALTVIIVWRVKVRKYTGMETSGDFKEGYSQIDYLLKDIENRIKDIKRLKNVFIAENVKFTAIDTVLVNNTGVYLVESDKAVSESDIEQYRYNSNILAGKLKIDKSNIIVIVVCENEKAITEFDDNIRIVNFHKAESLIRELTESREVIYDDAQIEAIYRTIKAFEHRNNKERDLR